MKSNRQHICMLLAATGLLILLSPSEAYLTGSFNLIGCQGVPIRQQNCSNGKAVYSIQSITILTSSDVDDIQSQRSSECSKAEKCRRTIHSEEDQGLSDDYLYLYNWILNRCNGKVSCGANATMPEWWALTDDSTECGKGSTQHFVGVLIDVQCRAGEEIVTHTPPPDTTPKTRPTTPTTTTSFPVFVDVYLPGLVDREKIVLAVAIGLAIAILIVLLVVLYCCEKYRNHKKFAKLLRMLGAPQATDDVFDDFEDYGKTDAWRDETDANLNALGEYTGVKPNEFMTLDKKHMESSGQIMYDTQTGTMTMGRGNSCSTLSKNGGVSTNPSGVQKTNYGVNGSYDYDYETEENLDLERRMAENLKTPNFEEDTSYH